MTSGFAHMTAQAWTSRSRVEAALNHQEADRVPYDLGGTILTGIHHQAYRRLRRHLGMTEAEISIEDPIQQLARVHEDIKQRLNVDVYGLNPSKPRGIGQPPWSEHGYDKILDEWGIEWWKPQDGGLYYDMRRHPLAEVDAVEDLARYRFPDPLDPGRYEGMAARADELINRNPVAYVRAAMPPVFSRSPCGCADSRTITATWWPTRSSPKRCWTLSWR